MILLLLLALTTPAFANPMSCDTRDPKWRDFLARCSQCECEPPPTCPICTDEGDLDVVATCASAAAASSSATCAAACQTIANAGAESTAICQSAAATCEAAAASCTQSQSILVERQCPDTRPACAKWVRRYTRSGLLRSERCKRWATVSAAPATP